MRELVELGVGAVGEDDDREFLIRVADDAGAESDRFAAVVDFLQSAILAEIPAEAITASGLSVGVCGRRLFATWAR